MFLPLPYSVMWGFFGNLHIMNMRFSHARSCNTHKTGLALHISKIRFVLSEGMIVSPENKDGLFLMPADSEKTASDLITFNKY